MATEIRTLEDVLVEPPDELVSHHKDLGESKLTGLIPVYLSGEVSLAPAIPDQMLLGHLRDGRLHVRTPIKVLLSTEGPHVIAEAVELDEFGFGSNVSEAVVDLQRAIAELHFSLEREEDRLGPDLQRTWSTLQEKIAVRQR